MKRVVGLILLGLGVMLLVLAPLLKFYVLPSAAKTPVDQYTESTADVTMRQLLVPAKVAAGDPDPYARDLPATQFIYVRGDVPASEQPEAQSQDLAVFDYFYRVTNNDTGELLSALTARYPFGRVNSELQNCCGASVNDEPVDMTGTIMPVKWPFNLEKTDYPIFNTSLKGAQTFSFTGEEEVFGVNTYVYDSEVPPTMVGTTEVPSSALPGAKKNATGNTVLDEMYSVKSTYWMDPVTGQVVKAESSEFSTFDLDGKQQLVKADYTGVSGNQEAADDIAALASQVKLIGSTLPLVFLILGIVLIVIGLLLLRGGTKDDNQREPVAVDAPTRA